MTPEKVRDRRTLALLATSAAAFAMLQTIISPVLPTIQQHFGTTQDTLSWVLIAYLLAAAVATPILGKIGDLVGKDRALRIALGTLALGCLVAALAPNVTVLLVGRVLQGCGGAVFPLSFGIVRDEFPPNRVPTAIGILSGVLGLGGGLGTVLAGPLVDLVGWRSLFWLPMLLVVAVAALSTRVVTPSPVRSGGRVNWLAATMLSAWLVALLLPLSMGARWGWSSPATVGLFAAAVVAAAAWAVIETRTDNPVIDIRMMRRRGVWAPNLIAFLLGAGMFGVLGFLPQLMRTPPAGGYGFGASVTVAGLLLAPMPILQATTSPVSGALAPWLGLKAQLAAGSALLALSSAGFALFHDSPWKVATGAGVFGIGLGMAYATLTSVIVQAVPATQTGTVSGVNANIRTVGGAVGTALVTAIVTASPQATGYPRESGFVDGFLTLALMCAAAMLLCLLIPASPWRSTGAPDTTGTEALQPGGLGGETPRSAGTRQSHRRPAKAPPRHRARRPGIPPRTDKDRCR